MEGHINWMCMLMCEVLLPSLIEMMCACELLNRLTLIGARPHPCMYV